MCSATASLIKSIPVSILMVLIAANPVISRGVGKITGVLAERKSRHLLNDDGARDVARLEADRVRLASLLGEFGEQCDVVEQVVQIDAINHEHSRLCSKKYELVQTENRLFESGPAKILGAIFEIRPDISEYGRIRGLFYPIDSVVMRLCAYYALDVFASALVAGSNGPTFSCSRRSLQEIH